jgi:hypothetical protein
MRDFSRRDVPARLRFRDSVRPGLSFRAGEQSIFEHRLRPRQNTSQCRSADTREEPSKIRG